MSNVVLEVAAVDNYGGSVGVRLLLRDGPPDVEELVRVNDTLELVDGNARWRFYSHALGSPVSWDDFSGTLVPLQDHPDLREGMLLRLLDTQDV